MHLQVERQADELRQRQRQVQLYPGGAEPGQRRNTHRPQTEAERQEGRRPEPSSREGPLHSCTSNTNTFKHCVFSVKAKADVSLKELMTTSRLLL